MIGMFLICGSVGSLLMFWLVEVQAKRDSERDAREDKWDSFDM